MVQSLDGATYSGRTVFAFLESISASVATLPLQPGSSGGRVEFLRHLKSEMLFQVSRPSNLFHIEKADFRLLEVTLDLLIHEKVQDQS